MRLSGLLRCLLAVALVAAATAVLVAVDADRIVAALAYVVVVVAAAFLGAFPAAIAVLAASAGFNYYFTPPTRTWRIEGTDGLVAFLVFAISAAAVSATVARVNQLRRRAQLREQEARARVELTDELVEGAEPEQVIHEAERTMQELFGVRSCAIVVDGARASVTTVPGLGPGDRAIAEAFAAGLATTLDRIRLGREAEQARLSAASEQGRAAFLAAMTHNLRTPLASIKTAVATLRMPELDPAARATLLRTTEQEADRLERLVTKVLELSRIHSGAITVRAEPIDVVDLCAPALRSVSPLAVDGRTVRLEIVSGGVVRADAALFDVALGCLLENAIRYAPGPILVEVRVDSQTLEVRVVDHGPGVPVAERERIFEEFVRGEGVRDTKGAGIGLAIARALVEAHRGSLSVGETPGGGATFVIRMPRGSS